MKNNIKKIIAFVSFALLFIGGSVFAASSTATWNGASNDCLPNLAVANWTTQTGFNDPCWTLSSVSASPGDFINVRAYYHNTGSTTATSTHISLSYSSASSTTHTITGQITSPQGNYTFGPVTVNISNAQTMTWSTTKWYPNQTQTPAPLLNGQSGSEVVTPTGLNIGDIAPGWSSQGGVVVGFQIGNNTPPPSNCSITSFTASPTSVNSGGSSTLAWNTTNCISATISGIGSVNTSGSMTVSPTQTTTYVLTAIGSSGAQQTQSVTVTVNQQQNCSITSFTASPTSINTGGSSTLTWNTNNCTSVTISNLGYNVPVTGSQVIYPTQTTTYTLTAYGSNGGQQTQSVTVTVNQQQNCSITSFTANGSTSTTIQQGSSATLAWNTTNCTSVAISGIGSVNNSGSMVVTPSVTTTYTLTAYGSGYWAQQTQSVTVNVTQTQNNCIISYFNASPTSINTGGTSTLSWSTTNCTSVTISNLGYNVPVTGSQVIYPTYTTTYVLTAYGTSGIQQTQSVTVTVNNYQNNCSISYFNASPTYVNTGGTSTLSWNTNGCNSVSISNLGYSVPLSGSQVIYPTYTTTYVLTAYGTSGIQQTQSVTVTVNNYNYNNCYISYFSASPTSINTGASSTLTWSTSNCTSVSISNLNYNVSTAGNQVVYPTGTTTYTLTAYGQNYGSNWAQQTQSVTVFVNPYVNPVNSCAVTTIPTNVTQSSATLNGMLTGNGSYNTYFEYGQTSDLGFQTGARSSNGNTSFSDVISGLPSGTVYYFRLVSNCGNSGISRGDLKVFQTLSAYVKPVVIQGTTVVGTSSPIMLKIENNSQSFRVGDTVYYTVTYKNIGSRTLTHPMVQVVLPDGLTFLSSSQGTYSDASKTLSVPLSDLNSGDQGTISLIARVDSLNSNNSQIVTTALLIYTNRSGAQENAIAYVLNNPQGSGSSLGALAFLSGFWGLGIIGWLLIIIIILLLILIYRRYFYRGPYGNTTTTTHTVDTHTEH